MYIFRDHRRLLIIPGLTLAGSIAIGQLIYSGEIRHWGINFVAFAAALWIERRWNPESSFAVTILLGISAVAGVAISIQQSQLTFSEAGPTARWIRDNGLAERCARDDARHDGGAGRGLSRQAGVLSWIAVASTASRSTTTGAMRLRRARSPRGWRAPSTS